MVLLLQAQPVWDKLQRQQEQLRQLGRRMAAVNLREPCIARRWLN